MRSRREHQTYGGEALAPLLAAMAAEDFRHIIFDCIPKRRISFVILRIHIRFVLKQNFNNADIASLRGGKERSTVA